MLPIFCELDRGKVFAAVNPDERKLIRGRPAFHYRLPDCKVNVPGWRVADPWNQWIYVEKVASNDALREELIDAWRKSNRKMSITPAAAWVARLTTILSQKYFAG
jgi:hypothetical protein